MSMEGGRKMEIGEMVGEWGDLKAHDTDEIKIEVYSDEINRVKLSLDNSTWMYLIVLFVPQEFKENNLILLNNLRCKQYKNWNEMVSTCPHQCGFHDKNDTEIHFRELHRSNARLQIAENWLNQFLIRESCHKNRKLLYFNILGSNLSNMNLGLFGDDTDRDLTIYNRFYRTALKSGLSYFFNYYKKISITKIYHDRGSQELHRLFPWHSIKKINIDSGKVKIEEDEIVFIDSDHRISGRKESHFIQLADLILGATHTCLHNPSEKDQKKEIALAFMPALKTILDRKRSQKGDFMEGSYYKSNYYRTQQVSFFPNKKMDVDEALNQLDVNGRILDNSVLTKREDCFYYDRPILLNSTSQSSLTRWF
jgi:hypothetical protein